MFLWYPLRRYLWYSLRRTHFPKIEAGLIKKNMTFWQVPVQEYNPTDRGLDKTDNTFSLLKYFSLFENLSALNDRIRSIKYTNKDLFENVSHVTHPVLNWSVLNNDGFVVNLDIEHFKPEEVTMKVEGRFLEVCGKHKNINENGFECSEFLRKYTIPDDVDPTALTSTISEDGILQIRAPKMLPLKKDTVEPTKETFKYCLDVKDFKPEEISVQMKGRCLLVHCETKTENTNEHGYNSHQKELTKNIFLPDDVDPSQLSLTYSKDFKLTIEAIQNFPQPPLQLQIKVEE
ncbi:uncharacterized protein LOC105843824 isoform X1 [Hydra vulgaris]|uniref:uncharacterized protein LOC105843824 isoform X1 n=1 Tax=Hydra vulgaris TaxID=6087 RepID=UPI001F5E80B8|nr:uncharacterized protein LOC105843824 [Hydra vulgaris]